MRYEQRFRDSEKWEEVPEADVRRLLGAGRDPWTWQILSKKLARGQVVGYCSLVDFRIKKRGEHHEIRI